MSSKRIRAEAITLPTRSANVELQALGDERRLEGFAWAAYDGIEKTLANIARSMTKFHLTGEALWERMERADRKVQERLERTATALEQAGVPYAIIGGNAVRA